MAEKEYLERAALEHHFMTKRQYLTKDMVMDAAYEINKFPAADVAPVVHGRWVLGKVEPGYFTPGGNRPWICSECGYLASWMLDKPKDNYCPNCGVKMDLEGR